MSAILPFNSTNQVFFSQTVSYSDFFNSTILTNLKHAFNLNKYFLVSHDNKPKLDAKAGYLLPRFGVVDVTTGRYHSVNIKDGSPLKLTKDLESLALIAKNRFIACQSNSSCFHFEVNKSEQGDFSAEFISRFKLPVPKINSLILRQ